MATLKGSEQAFYSSTEEPSQHQPQRRGKGQQRGSSRGLARAADRGIGQAWRERAAQGLGLGSMGQAGGVS